MSEDNLGSTTVLDNLRVTWARGFACLMVHSGISCCPLDKIVCDEDDPEGLPRRQSSGQRGASATAILDIVDRSIFLARRALSKKSSTIIFVVSQPRPSHDIRCTGMRDGFCKEVKLKWWKRAPGPYQTFVNHGICPGRMGPVSFQTVNPPQEQFVKNAEAVEEPYD
ncbi:hypothetical protein E2C01_068526 [Portunus trituberculatus]|uniref:Uncharacterized protein n=1 Tax=Portunus trituberculatus TaxID=210409 RepID=A0A5B7HWQ3_PORTR|nr:hypothetical protein [Portunus trituberculatus]